MTIAAETTKAHTEQVEQKEAIKSYELAGYGTFFGIVVTILLIIVRSQFAKSKGVSAENEHIAANTDASVKIFDEYKKMLDQTNQLLALANDKYESLSSRLQNVENELRQVETELANMELAYMQSAAGEKRYRDGFANLYSLYCELNKTARALGVSTEMLVELDRRVMELMLSLTRPLNIPILESNKK